MKRNGLDRNKEEREMESQKRVRKGGEREEKINEHRC